MNHFDVMQFAAEQERRKALRRLGLINREIKLLPAMSLNNPDAAAELLETACAKLEFHDNCVEVFECLQDVARINDPRNLPMSVFDAIRRLAEALNEHPHFHERLAREMAMMSYPMGKVPDEDTQRHDPNATSTITYPVPPPVQHAPGQYFVPPPQAGPRYLYSAEEPDYPCSD